MIPGNRQRNYFQSALYVAIAGVVAAVLLERLLTYAEVAEKAAMEATISRVQAGLYAKVAYLVLRGDLAAIELLPTQNPFLAANVRSPNFLGEFDGVPTGVESGNWLYDRSRGELVYVPNLTRYLSVDSANGGVRKLRYRVELRKAGKSTYTGLAIVPVGQGVWAPSP